MTPLSRTWTLTRTFQGSPPSGSVDRLSGTVKLHLGRDRVARFSSGETGVWGVKARGSAAGKVASGADDENNYDGAFDGGVCLEVRRGKGERESERERERERTRADELESLVVRVRT